MDIKQQLPIVRGGVEILVATPGRLLDHIEQKSVYLGQVEIFVLDEADRMLDMGFIPDIKRIMALLPVTAKRQNLLFSATFSGEIKKLADQLLNAPQLIEVAKRNTAADTVSQLAYKVPAEAKRALLEHLVRSRNLTQVLCFMRTKHGTSRLARQLEKDGLVVDAIHGDKSQQTRMEALAAFKEGKLQVLVATDVAARGLDIDDLPLVVNFELPYVPEDYIHRIGRTGRAGASGEAISFVAPEEEKYLADIERLLKKTILIRSRRRIRSVVGSHRARTPHNAIRRGRAPAARTSRRARGPRAARTLAANMRTRARRLREERSARASEHRARARRARIRAIERERAYALNPDQPAVAPRADRRASRRLRAHAFRRTSDAPRLRSRTAGACAADEAHTARARKAVYGTRIATFARSRQRANSPDAAARRAVPRRLRTRGRSRSRPACRGSRAIGHRRSTRPRAAASSSAGSADSIREHWSRAFERCAADLRPLALLRHRTARALRPGAAKRGGPTASRRLLSCSRRFVREFPLAGFTRDAPDARPTMRSGWRHPTPTTARSCPGSRARSRRDSRSHCANAACHASPSAPDASNRARRPSPRALSSTARRPTWAQASRHGRAVGRWAFPACGCRAAHRRVRR